MEESQRVAAAVVFVLLAGYMLTFFHRVMTGVLKPEVGSYAGYYGLDPAVLLGVMASAYFYGYAASQLFTGVMLDAYGVKRFGSIMLAVMGLATLLMLLPNPYTLILGRGLLGFASAVIFLSYLRMSALGFAPNVQARLAGLLLFAGYLSTILATYPLRLLLDAAGLQATLTALALIAFALAAVLFASSSDVGWTTSGPRGPLSALRVIVGDRHVWATGIAALSMAGVGLAYLSAWGQFHLERFFSMDKHDVSLHLMLIAAAATATIIPMGYLSDRLGRRKPFLLVGVTLSSASWLLLYSATVEGSTLLLDAALVGMGMAVGFNVVSPTMAKEPYDPNTSATAVSVYNTTVTTGIAVLQTALTPLDPLTSVKASIAVTLTGAFAAAALTRETYVGGRQ